MVIWATELYPTTIRAVGLGNAFVLGLLGTLASPYVIELGMHSGINSMLVLAFCCIFGIASAFFLEETLDKPMK